MFENDRLCMQDRAYLCLIMSSGELKMWHFSRFHFRLFFFFKYGLTSHIRLKAMMLKTSRLNTVMLKAWRLHASWLNARMLHASRLKPWRLHASSLKAWRLHASSMNAVWRIICGRGWYSRPLPSNIQWCYPFCGR